MVEWVSHFFLHSVDKKKSLKEQFQPQKIRQKLSWEIIKWWSIEFSNPIINFLFWDLIEWFRKLHEILQKKIYYPTLFFLPIFSRRFLKESTSPERLLLPRWKLDVLQVEVKPRHMKNLREWESYKSHGYLALLSFSPVKISTAHK